VELFIFEKNVLPKPKKFFIKKMALSFNLVLYLVIFIEVKKIKKGVYRASPKNLIEAARDNSFIITFFGHFKRYFFYESDKLYCNK